MSLSALLVSACGGSSSGPIKNVSPSTTSGASGAKTFSAPGMALHFRFPGGFRTIALAPARRVIGDTRQATRAAVGVGPYDLLVVIRYPNRSVAVTAQNLPRLRSTFDRAMTAAYGAAMSSTVTIAGGLPALAYPSVAAPGLPVQATTRNMLVFVGDDEYQLSCQYTPKAQATITAACDQMLRTLK